MMDKYISEKYRHTEAGLALDTEALVREAVENTEGILV